MKAKRSVAAKRFLVLFGVSAKKNTLRHPVLPVLKRYENCQQKGKNPFGGNWLSPPKERSKFCLHRHSCKNAVLR